jgi:hypothetical protein
MESIATAKQYVTKIYAEEAVTNLGLEEVEHSVQAGQWIVTLGFSRPWNTPRTRAHEVLENLVGRHRRTSHFSLYNDMLGMITASFSNIIVLPHVLPETSNLARQISNPERRHIAISLRKYICLVCRKFRYRA